MTASQFATPLSSQDGSHIKRRHKFYNFIKGRFNTSTIDEDDEPKGIFGASLGYASQWSSLQPHGLTVPDPVAKCFTEIIKRGMHIEGLFRLSGAASDVRQLANEFDRPPYYGKHLDLSTYDIHTITGVVKKYLRALPEPVIPRHLHSRFLQTASSLNDNNTADLEDLAHLILELPRLHRHLLCYILILAGTIQQHADVNMMCADALAVVLAPVSTGLEQLLQHNVTKKKRQLLRREEMTDLVQTNAQWTMVWTAMIENYETLLDRCMPKMDENDQKDDDPDLREPTPPFQTLLNQFDPRPTTTASVFATTPPPRRHQHQHHQHPEGWRSLFTPPDGARRVLKRLASASSMRPPSVHHHWV
ncbi:hypothetical protein RO3G_08289 [Lichtheimia corymbifera JMRC:FSU:9682]|uniref:Rho-GAP domain-containing protein n=1 Tax=Lichtheimia corymbifera JMRC:FSU:9682 TaxID=1263082 RepID=A0A068S4H4_9FUNG|nr:hypothetical protein RO3G_08289 [Lichtheimia corymbifera JMRC:FSU:9682]